MAWISRSRCSADVSTSAFFGVDPRKPSFTYQITRLSSNVAVRMIRSSAWSVMEECWESILQGWPCPRRRCPASS